MSFILDALKKSESERQQQGAAEFAQVPVGRDSNRPPLWLWLLGLLLLVNLVVLAGVLLRPAPERLPAAEVAGDSFAEQLERAQRQKAAAIPPPRNDAQPDTVASPPVAATRPETATANEIDGRQTDASALRTAPGSAATALPVTPATARPSPSVTRPADDLPDIDQLRADGELPIGPLRLDIHVYSDVASERFVFINMVKHREGSTTSDGLSVDTITRDGVVLSYRGRQFLLPRQ